MCGPCSSTNADLVHDAHETDIQSDDVQFEYHPLIDVSIEGEAANAHLSQIAFNDLSRRDVRSLIFHLLYAVQAYDYEESLQSIVDNFNRGFNLSIPLKSELVKVTQAIIDERELLEKMYEPFLTNWRTERVSVCTKLILFFGIWELKNTDTDQRIVINEAIELAKGFAEDDAYRFVNGILDAIAKELKNEN